MPESPPTVSFAAALRRAVDERLDPETMRVAFRHLHRKALVVIAWYVASYVAVIAASGWVEGTLACASLALSFAAVGFNIQHDANHNAFFDTSGRVRLTRANRIVGWSMYLVGADANRWIYRHGTLHHGSPNVVGVDSDINLGALARFAPAQRWHPWHRYQHLYLWPLYCFTALELMLRDVTLLVVEARRPTPTRPRPRWSNWVTVITTKVAFVTALVAGPALAHPLWVVAVGAAAVMFATGALLGVVFQSAHVVTEAEFASAQNRLGYQFHEWQVRSSVDFSHGDGPVSRALRWYVGGLDHQTEHHLFPRLPHTTYPLIAPAVTRVCEQFGVPRHVQPSFHAALASHARQLRDMGRRPADQ